MGTLTLQPNCLENFWSPEHDMIFVLTVNILGLSHSKWLPKTNGGKLTNILYNKSQREEDFRT